MPKRPRKPGERGPHNLRRLEEWEKRERDRKQSIGFNFTGKSKSGRHLDHYGMSAELWDRTQAAHGIADGVRGVKEAKKFVHKHYPHRWLKFDIHNNDAHRHRRKK